MTLRGIKIKPIDVQQTVVISQKIKKSESENRFREIYNLLKHLPENQEQCDINTISKLVSNVSQ